MYVLAAESKHFRGLPKSAVPAGNKAESQDGYLPQDSASGQSGYSHNVPKDDTAKSSETNNNAEVGKNSRRARSDYIL